MKELYIKFIEGDKESYDRAVEAAIELGYEGYDIGSDYKEYGILKLDEDGDFFVTSDNEYELKSTDYEEYIVEDKASEIQEGEIVYVSDESEEDASEGKVERIFLMKLNKESDFPFLVTKEESNQAYREGNEIQTNNFKYVVRKATDVKEVSMDEIAEKFGVSVENLTIKK